jgi:hypothetical protein
MWPVPPTRRGPFSRLLPVPSAPVGRRVVPTPTVSRSVQGSLNLTYLCVTPSKPAKGLPPPVGAQAKGSRALPPGAPYRRLSSLPGKTTLLHCQPAHARSTLSLILQFDEGGKRGESGELGDTGCLKLSQPSERSDRRGSHRGPFVANETPPQPLLESRPGPVKVRKAGRRANSVRPGTTADDTYPSHSKASSRLCQ